MLNGFDEMNSFMDETLAQIEAGEAADLEALRQLGLPLPGSKVVVVSGEFRGKVLAVGRVYSDLIELQSLDQESLAWVDFCSVGIAEFNRMTRPL